MTCWLPHYDTPVIWHTGRARIRQCTCGRMYFTRLWFRLHFRRCRR